MKAVSYSTFGSARDALKLEEVEAILPGPGEVTVDLKFSGVNPSDVKARAGSRPGVTKPPFPKVVPHSDGAGIISAVGEGVNPDRIGTRVWLWNGQWRRPYGTAAMQITLPEDQAVPLPDSVDMETGASMGIPGLTACFTVFSAGDITGKTVFIQGGAGTVGYLAVQLAKWGGARVITTARGEGANRAREAGADVVLDYTAENLAAQVLAANDGRPVERIIEVEFGTNLATDTEVIAENGVICAYGSAQCMNPCLDFYPLLFKAVTIEIALIYLLTPQQRTDTINRLTQALRENALHCPVEKIFTLSECAQAHEAVEAGNRAGAILIRTE